MKVLSFLVATLLTVSMWAQSPENILRSYKNNDGVMSLKFDGDIMGLLDKENGEEVKSTLEYMDVIFFKEGTDVSDDDKQKIKDGLLGQNYELLVNAKKDGNKIKVMGLDQGDTLSKVYVSAHTEKANVYVIVKGNIYFDEIKDLNLDKLENIF